MNSWYKLSFAAVTAVWLVLPPHSRADAPDERENPAFVPTAPQRLVPPQSTVRPQVPAYSYTPPGARSAPPSTTPAAQPRPASPAPRAMPTQEAGMPSPPPAPPPPAVKPAQPAAAQAAPVERPAEPTQAAEHSMQQPAAVPAPPRPPAQRPATAATARPGAAPPARSTPTQAASLPPPQPRASGSGQAKLLMGPPLARLSSRPPQIGQGPAQGSSTANAVVTRVAVPLAPPAPPVAGEVFVVGPTSELDPGRYGSQTACVGGENVLLGRSIFANSMIVPDHNRAAALKLGLCQVIMVTRRPDAEAARRMLSNMGVTADIRQK